MAGETPTIDPEQQLAAVQAQAYNPVNAASLASSQPLSTLIPPQSAADVLAGIQRSAAAAGPVSNAPISSDATVPSQPLTGTVPEPPMSPGTWKHMEWLHNALNHVADALAPGEISRVVPQADGSFTVEKQPTSTKEKWGMIAARALGGAAQGLANSQGPGGLAKAAAAGTQYGLQQPKEQQQEAEQTADFKNKAMLSAANLAHVKQQVYLMGIQGKLADLQYDEVASEMMKKQLEYLTSSGGREIGTVDTSDPKSLMNLSAQIPNLAKLLGPAGDQEAIPVPIGNHKYKLIVHDKDWFDRPVDAGLPIYGKRVDKDGNFVTQQVGTTTANSKTTNRDFQTFSLNTYKDIAAGDKAQADAKKAMQTPAPKPLDTPGKTLDAWRQETDPQKKAELWKQYEQLRKDDIAQKVAGRTPAAPPSQSTVEAWETMLTDPSTNTTMAMVKAGPLRDAIVADMAQKGIKPTHPLNNAELNRADLAKIGSVNIAEAQRILHEHPEIFGPSGKAKTSFAQLFKGGNEFAKQFQAAINTADLPTVGVHGVKGKYAVEDLKKLDSELYTNPQSMELILGEIQRSLQEIARTGGRDIDIGAGGSKPPAKTETKAETPPASMVPLGHTVTFKNHGGIWKNDNGTISKVGDN